MSKLTLAVLLFAAGTLRLAASSVVVSDTADPCLRLRASPHADARVVKCLAPGTAVEVLEQAPYWRKVRLGDVRGWAAKKFLTELPSAEVAEAPANPWLEVHIVDVAGSMAATSSSTADRRRATRRARSSPISATSLTPVLLSTPWS